MSLIARITSRLRKLFAGFGQSPNQKTESADGRKPSTKAEPKSSEEPDPEPTPGEPYEEDGCWHCDDNPDADGRIEIGVFRREGDPNGLDAIEVTAEYLRYAFCEAWGDQYRIDVTAHTDYAAPEDISDFGPWIGHIKDELPSERKAKDVNLLVADHGSGMGATPYYATGGRPPAIAELNKHCVERRGSTRAHEHVNIALHEAGHAVGLGHEVGDTVNGDASIMATTYADAGSWSHEFSDAAKQQGPEVR